MATIRYRTKQITFHADGREEIGFKEHSATWPDAAVANFAKSHPDAVVSIGGHARSAPDQVPVKYADMAEINDFDEVEDDFDGLPPSAFDLGSMINEEMRA